MPAVPMGDGRWIPPLGLGLWRVPDAQAARLVRTAVEAGYRLIDTAAAYGNERGVGEGLRSVAAGPAVFVCTKLPNEDQGYDRTLRACERSLQRLGLQAIDLYLIHWPMPARGLYVESWRALIRLRAEGRVRSIGVSNFEAAQLQRLVDETGEAPVLNQVELHPWHPQQALRRAHARLGLRTQCWSPLGQGRLLQEPVLQRIAARHGRTAAQVLLRWHLDQGLIAIPKSAHPDRLRENLDVGGLQLTPGERAAIDALERAGGRIGPEPARVAC
ncbi:MAG TPA: aldo/keto reductase [Burkholderiaceae bacterium]|nr:aldo/keto reductase [Burkholderiaceae bacterium]